ncbi:protein required for attachment to host cells [Rhodoligotrophos appendicifer]|uniref:baeRF12 domain-containing protein n=1 Tax=Rhodoligotrophos appendicifer TaxID=987056 RepID=UPI001186418E|nr:host attachment family protein [Rhodoligotrophos appendicifer]
MSVRLHHDEHVLVCDGTKALLLRNQGDAIALNLQVEREFSSGSNPKTSDQGTERPGRQQGRSFPTSAVEQTDWHQQGEDEFVRSVAEAINDTFRDRAAGGMIVAAPPKALAELRRHLDPAVTSAVKAELDKELTNLPVNEIEKHVARLWT